jgi:hypothetical protein
MYNLKNNQRVSLTITSTIKKLFRAMESWNHFIAFIGIDELLARHIAHLFIRDPLVIYQELLDQDDAKSSDHFEVP